MRDSLLQCYRTHGYQAGPDRHTQVTVPRQDSELFSVCCPLLAKPPAHKCSWDNSDHVMHVVRRLLAWRQFVGRFLFKIGIVADPVGRFRNAEFGYALEGLWHFMDVLLEGPADLCRDLEIQLIAAFGCVLGCYNDKPGGEGVNPTRKHVCSVYVVMANASSGVGLRNACLKRRRLEVTTTS